MANVVRNPYSNTAGNTPSSLGNGQLGVNQADGRLFYRAASGAVTTFSSIASYATVASFPATGSTSVLYLASDTSRIHQWTGSVYVEVGAAGNAPPHASSHATGGSDAITPASIGAATYEKIKQQIFNYPTTGIDVYPRGEVVANVAQQPGIVLYTFFTPTETLTVSSITAATASIAGAGLTLARMGLYTFDESVPSATLVARTANDTTLFNATFTAYTRSFDTTGGYPASYTLVAGSRYGVAVFSTGTTVPNYAGKNCSNPVTNLFPRTAYGTGGATDLTASPPGYGNVGAHIFARLS